MYAAILAGGVGTRLWPRSRQARPKQFSDIVGSGRTMIQMTADRLSGLVPSDRQLVVTGTRYVSLVSEQLGEIPADNIIAEPSGRNTAPAIGLACIEVRRRDPHGLLVVLPADHTIRDPERFRECLRIAAEYAEEGYLVTLGIEPDQPHTGYGYIEHGRRLSRLQGYPVYRVERFLEKPDYATAESFLSQRGYSWNGGIFVCRVDRMLEEMTRQMPVLYELLETISVAYDRGEGDEVLAQVWNEMPNISIDYGIMEKATAIAMVPMNVGWSDVGSWDALEQVYQMNEDGNYSSSNMTLSLFSQGNIVNTQKRLVALIGIQYLVMIETDDVLLVGRKQEMQQVRGIVELLTEQGYSALL